MILTSLVLLPVMAHAQARTSAEPQPSSSSVALVAELTQPATMAELALKAVSTKAVLPAGTLEFAMMGTVPKEASPATVTRAVEVQLSTEELAEQPAVCKVVVHANVDASGVPHDVAVTQSGGSLIDRKVIEAVNQYRFKPATLDSKPTWSSVSISIKIQKP
jgi:TonB family protein